MTSGKQRLEVLQEDWFGCTRCPLGDLRKRDKIVFGDGPVPADIMIIGSHPTESDEYGGTPFTGEEGDLLIELLEGVGINPGQCYRTHLVACRPTIVIPQTADEKARVETVPPTKEHYSGFYDKKEKAQVHLGCNERLWRQIYEVDPRIIIVLGEVPLKLMKARDNNGALPKKMSEAQGDLFEIQIPGHYQNLRYPAIAALGMGYLIKNPAVADHGPIAVVMEALRRAKTYVNWIHEKEEL